MPREPFTSPYDLLGRPVYRQYLPYAIAKHVGLVPALLRNLQLYCEAHPDWLNDPTTLGVIDMFYREQNPDIVLLEGEAASELAFQMIFYPPLSLLLQPSSLGCHREIPRAGRGSEGSN
jgi:hypothetical protein